MMLRFLRNEPNIEDLAEQSGFCNFYSGSAEKFAWMRDVIETDNHSTIYFRRNKDDTYVPLNGSFNMTRVVHGTANFLCLNSSGEACLYRVGIEEIWKAKESGQKISLDNRRAEYAGKALSEHLVIESRKRKAA